MFGTIAPTLPDDGSDGGFLRTEYVPLILDEVFFAPGGYDSDFGGAKAVNLIAYL